MVVAAYEKTNTTTGVNFFAFGHSQFAGAVHE
jgi:hypothetical protein